MKALHLVKNTFKVAPVPRVPYAAEDTPSFLEVVYGVSPLRRSGWPYFPLPLLGLASLLRIAPSSVACHRCLFMAQPSKPLQ
jgi:hypothetical protein